MVYNIIEDMKNSRLCEKQFILNRHKDVRVGTFGGIHYPCKLY